jgi:hypothetical protein
MKKLHIKAFVALWMALLLCLGIYYAGFAPRESRFTETENRTLAGFPEVTAESVFSGRFGQEFETYLLDQFPIRDKTINTVNRLESLLSFASHDDYLLIAEDVEDPLDTSDFEDELEQLLAEMEKTPTVPPTEPTVETEPAAGTEPDMETEPPENPPIEQKPEASAEDFPLVIGVYMDIGQGETVLQQYNRNRAVAVTAVLNKFAAQLPENGKLMFTIGPASRLLYRFANAEEKVSMHSTWDEVINAISADNVYAFDAPEILSSHIQNGEYVSFRNDNHWTPWGAYQVYKEMATRAGKELADYEEDFDITVEEGFRGTYYRDNPSAYWNVEPDTLERLMPKINVEYRKLTGPDTYEVIDFIKLDAIANDRYTVYLGGPGGPWRYVECDNGETENCLVVTDSFGLTVIPFLTQNYKQIHYYDARYFNRNITGGSVADMIAKYNIHDIYVIIADFHSFDSGFLISDVNYHLGLQ